MTNRPCEVNDLESPFGAITTKMQLCIGDDLLRQGVIHSRSIYQHYTKAAEITLSFFPHFKNSKIEDCITFGNLLSLAES